MQSADSEERALPEIADDIGQRRRLRRGRYQFRLIGLFGLTYVVAVIGAYWRLLGPEGSLSVVTWIFTVAYVFAPLFALLLMLLLPAMSRSGTVLGVCVVCAAMLIGVKILCSLHKTPEMFAAAAGGACCLWPIQGVVVALALAMPGFARKRRGAYHRSAAQKTAEWPETHEDGSSDAKPSRPNSLDPADDRPPGT